MFVHPCLVFLLVAVTVSRDVGPTVGLSNIVHPRFRCLGLDYHIHVKLLAVRVNP